MQDGEDMYGGGGPTMAETPQDDSKPHDESKEGDEKEHKTFLLNKDIDPSFNVGEEMVVKIVAVHDKEYEVEYSESPSKEEGGDKSGMADEAPSGMGESPEAGGSMYG